MPDTKPQHDLIQQLADAGREFYRRGWVLGTSGNFSAVLGRNPLRFCITASGLEKGNLGEKSFLELEENSGVVSGSGKPSAETSLHQTLYRLIPNAASVMHTHSVWGTIISDRFFELGAIEIEGYEMLKGLSGVSTHVSYASLVTLDHHTLGTVKRQGI